MLARLGGVGGRGLFLILAPRQEREGDGLRRVHDAELTPLGADHANLRRLDAMIAADGRERVDVATLIRARAGAAPGRRKRIGHQ